MGYRTLSEGSAIYHTNSGLQITNYMFINGYFMLLFDITPDKGESEGHTSHPDNGNIRIELSQQAITRDDHVPAVPRTS